MTSSDLTLLPDDAKDRAAARVGTSIDGAPSAGGGSRRRPGGPGLRRVQRRHHRPPADRGPRRPGGGRLRSGPGRRGLGPGRLRAAGGGPEAGPLRVGGRGDLPGRGHPGRHRPLRLRGRRVCRRPAAGPAGHRRPRGLRGPDHRHRRPGPGPLGGRRGQQGAGGGRDRRWPPSPPSRRWRRCRPGPGSGSRSGGADAPAGPAQGLAREGHPRSVRRRRPERHPLLGGRLPGLHRRSPGGRGADPAPPGDPPLRGRRPLRRGHHRPGLGGGAGERGDLARGAPVLEGHRQPHPGGAGRAHRLPGDLGGRPGPRRHRARRSGAGVHRVPRAHRAAISSATG